MATTITQKPNLLSAANTPLIYILTEGDAAVYNAPKFRYILEVEINGVKKAQLKIHKNPLHAGIFDISKIVSSYIDTTLTNENSDANSIHSLGIVEAAKPFGQNNNQCAKVTVKAFYEKATSVTTAPTKSSQQAASDSFVIPATTPFTLTEDNVGGLDHITSSPSSNNFPLTYFMNSTSAEDSYVFFSNSPTVQFVRGSSTSADNLDQLTICFKQGDSGAGILDQGCKLEYMFVEYFNSSGVAIAGSTGSATWYALPNSTTSGGSTAAQSTTVDKAILYFGCGTKNLESQAIASVVDSEGATVGGANARPSNHTNWAYYRIYGSTNATTTNRCTKYYYFYRYGSGAKVDDRHQSCTRYDNIRLAWVNRLGAWDYMNFRGKSTESITIESSEMDSLTGTWDSANYNYNAWDRGKKTLFKKATKKIIINSDYLNEDEAVWMEELFTSREVQILNDDYTIIYPVVITDKAYTKKTTVNDKLKIQYTLNLEYSNKIRTNS